MNTNYHTIIQMPHIVNDMVRQATGRDPVQNIKMDYVTVGQKYLDTDFDLSDYAHIQRIVQTGRAKEFFSLGQRIPCKWSPDGVSEYDIPWIIVSFDPAPGPDGAMHENAMWIQSEYALAPVQFSGNNAFYVGDLEPGTYHFSMGNSWGANVVAGKSYQFTLTVAAKQLVLGTATSNTSGLPDTAPEKWRVRSYQNGSQLNPDEIVPLTEGTAGTDLGILSSSTLYSTSGMNNLQRAAYGYNRYSQSALRQWLNSDSAVGEWWTPKNPFDHQPNQLPTLRGFMAGLPQEFREIIKPVNVTTALNQMTDTALGTYDTVQDYFFPASLEQEYIVPQAAGIEGSYWPYWKERLELESPQAQGSGGANPAHIRYAYENHNSVQGVRLRSANRANAFSAWLVYTIGSAYDGTAASATRPAPAGVIY